MRLPENPIYILDEEAIFLSDEFGAKCWRGEAIDRLAEYEDIRFTPTEIKCMLEYGAKSAGFPLSYIMTTSNKFLLSIGGAVVGLLLTAVVAFITGIIIMFLWNWLVPSIFNLRSINYIEGWGLAYLSGLFFKGTQTVQTTTK